MSKLSELEDEYNEISAEIDKLNAEDDTLPPNDPQRAVNARKRERFGKDQVRLSSRRTEMGKNGSFDVTIEKS